MTAPGTRVRPPRQASKYERARLSTVGGTAATERVGRRWGIYVRISQDASGERLGVARQEDDCRRLAAEKGGLVIKVFSDNDISAWSGRRRPGYQAMLQAIRDRVIDGVVVYNLDRLTRRPIELEEFMELAEQHGLELGNVAGEIDLSNHYGQMMARVRGAVARAASDDASMRIKRKMVELREGGALTGGGRFYGWTNRCTDAECDEAHKRLRIVEAEAAIITECCDRVLAGESINSITKELNARGVTTSRGRPWDRKTLRNMLLRGRNGGLVEQFDKVDGVMKVVGKATAWQPIVTEEVWRSVCVILQDKSRSKHYTTNKVQNLLSHIATCGVCGDLMITGVAQVTSSTADGQKVKAHAKTYKCRTGGSGHPARRKAPIDELVVEAVLHRLELADLADLLRPHLDDEQRDVEAEIASIESQMEQHAILLADNVMTPAQFSTVNARLMERLENAKNLREPVRQELVLRDFAGERAVRDVWAELSMDRQRAVIRALCTVQISKAPRKGKVFDPTSVVITWL